MANDDEAARKARAERIHKQIDEINSPSAGRKAEDKPAGAGALTGKPGKPASGASLRSLLDRAAREEKERETGKK